jgi:hypothetical protein
VRTGGGEVVEDMGELEGAVADGDGGGGGVVVLVVLLRRRRRALGGGLALPGRVALDDFGPGFTRQGRQRRAASSITCRSVNSKGLLAASRSSHTVLNAYFLRIKKKNLNAC